MPDDLGAGFDQWSDDAVRQVLESRIDMEAGLAAAEPRGTPPRKRMASAVLFYDDQARILLVEPTYKDGWEFPGGKVEVGESPYRAAVREVREELGLAIRPGRLLVVDWVPECTGRTEGVVFVYAGGVLDEAQVAQIRLHADELRGWAWLSLAEAQQRLSPLRARRATAAVTAVNSNRVLSLEDGHPVA